MNQIEKLLTERCPDGVEFKALGSLVSKTGSIRWADNLGVEFRYIDLSSVDRVTHAILETSVISDKDAPSRAQQVVRSGDIIFGTTRPMLKRLAVITNEYDGQICSTGFCVLRPDDTLILTDYLFHVLGTDAFYSFVEANERGSNYPAIPDGEVKRFCIPVPPLEVQREVASVLNRLKHLELELAAQLKAELEARHRQYRFYRDALLSSDNEDKQKTKMVALGELGSFTRGRRFTKDDYAPNGISCIHYGDIYTRYGISAVETVSHVRADLAPSLRFAKTGDVVIAAVGETVEDVGKAVAWLGEDDVAVHDDCFTFQHDQNPKFISYCLQTTSLNAEKNKFVARAKVKRLSGESLAKLQIPVPPLEEQARIVGILDKFDALVNDLSSGLPAEINARRQQYQHYRDRLLTFKMAA